MTMASATYEQILREVEQLSDEDERASKKL